KRREPNHQCTGEHPGPLIKVGESINGQNVTQETRDSGSESYVLDNLCRPPSLFRRASDEGITHDKDHQTTNKSIHQRINPNATVSRRDTIFNKESIIGTRNTKEKQRTDFPIDGKVSWQMKRFLQGPGSNNTECSRPV
ncbi:hypothetical protein Bbelb_001600, partial [Branchiostoma belcheri]